jgi:hypothetical protein
MNHISGIAELHAITHGDPVIKIAVLDGPVDLRHPCFHEPADNSLPGNGEAVQPSAIQHLALHHGTAVYSIIFGKTGSPVQGVAPGCSGLNIPIYDEDEQGNFSPASQLKLAKSIKIALSQGAHIINISGGQFSKYGDPEFLLKQAIADCYKAGVLIVAAAGNEGCNCLHIPAADRQVLAVGSMDENGHPTPETNFGSHYQINGILAPGKNLTAALAGGATFKTSGATSYATPVMSGMVALLMSVQIKYGLAPDAYAIKSLLENTATPCGGNEGVDCNRFLRGAVNLPAAMAAIKENINILTSGFQFTHHKKIIAMPPDPQPEMEAIALPAPAEAPEPPLPDMSEDTGVALQQPVTDTMLPEENVPQHDEELSVTASAHITETAVTGGIAVAALASSRDGPAVTPSDNTLTVLENHHSNQNTKTSNQKNMENNTQNQQAGVSGTTASASYSQNAVLSGVITPSDCGCSGNKETGHEDGGNGQASAPPPAAIVYALGTLGYDFGSEAHQDSMAQSMGGANPNDPAALLKYLKANPWASEELTWTLNIDSTPIYALFPSGSHSTHGFERLRQYLEQQQNGNIQRISVPGVSQGTTMLLNGHTVDNLVPNLRGMYSWTTEALTASAAGAKGSAKALAENVSNFLNRIYYQMRNMGVTPQERSLNYAATNAYQVSAVFAAALKENLELHDIASEKSPICRPGSDCYDVTLSFFNPKERLTVARKEFRFTIDVSDVVPVTVGEVRSWSVYN